MNQHPSFRPALPRMPWWQQALHAFGLHTFRRAENDAFTWAQCTGCGYREPRSFQTLALDQEWQRRQRYERAKAAALHLTPAELTDLAMVARDLAMWPGVVAYRARRQAELTVARSSERFAHDQPAATTTAPPRPDAG